MTEAETVCAREGCEETFEKKKHNQKYHSDACTRLATSARLMARYYRDKDRRNGEVRTCEKCEGKLSRYNPENICASCTSKRNSEMDEEVANLISALTK